MRGQRVQQGARRARLYDRLGGRLIAAGGIGVIIAVLGIFLFTLRETYPLFVPARAAIAPLPPVVGPDQALAASVDPFRQSAVVIHASAVGFYRLSDGELLERHAPPALAPGIAAAYVSPQGHQLALALRDGTVVTGAVAFETEYADQQRRVVPRLELGPATPLADPADSIHTVACGGDAGQRAVVAALTRSGRLLVLVRERRPSLFGRDTGSERRWDLGDDLQDPPTAVVVGDAARQLVVGTAGGELVEWRLGAPDVRPQLVRAFVAAAPGVPVTALEYLLGGVSLAVGDARGGVSTWFKVRETSDAEPAFRRIHVLRAHRAPVVRIAPSQRDRQLATADATGEVAVHHATSEQTFWSRHVTSAGVRHLVFAPKADALLVLSDAGHLITVALHNPHPEISARVLFGKVWYEGYDAPAHVWQSTGATDEFEPKFSLLTLIFGTAKGTLYALLFALPLAVLAAIYTAEFAPPALRSLVKPVVEVMASLPSVILGFLAGLWLAPLLADRVVAAAAMLAMVPPAVVLCGWGWQALPRRVRGRLPRHAELGVITAAVAAGSLLGLRAGPWLEQVLFGGSLRTWLAAHTSLRYEQRNCLVVGFAMGFAVIPLIFTICEDALSSVPQSLRAASLALGANRWQTALRVVLPMAAPGVFSAAMIGFGRAIGETMIVLMATGNTPIMEWNAFTGMRTISANIAVELPEAPHEGTLYRVLFLSGLLLFVVTFAVNTAAETVRQRLRARCSRV